MVYCHFGCGLRREPVAVGGSCHALTLGRPVLGCVVPAWKRIPRLRAGPCAATKAAGAGSPPGPAGSRPEAGLICRAGPDPQRCQEVPAWPDRCLITGQDRPVSCVKPVWHELLRCQLRSYVQARAHPAQQTRGAASSPRPERENSAGLERTVVPKDSSCKVG